MKKLDAFGTMTEQLVAAGRKTPAIGIDLGTTNTAVGVIQSGETPKIITLGNGQKTIPSCVMWKGKKGEFIVGKEAYNNRYKPNTIYSVKSFMGTDEKIELRYGAKKLVMTPEEVSAEILKEVIRLISSEYKDITDAVITVPARFDNRQVSSTLEAGKLAGLNVLYIMREPTAASLCYQNDLSGRKDEKILVYDLGGGTFDASLLRISKSEKSDELTDFYGFEDKNSSFSSVIYTVLDTDGDSHLGGDDVDKELYKIIETKLSDLGHDITSIPTVEKEKIILRLEKLKKVGSGSCSMTFSFKLMNGNKLKEQIFLSEQDFVTATEVIYKKTKEKIKAIFSRNETSDIKAISLVGGSTKSAIIRQLLRKDFPNMQINHALEPDESVALGAAIKAKECKFGDTKIEVFDVLPLSIGVLSDGIIKPVIPKNQRVPSSATSIFSTVEDNQESIDVHIYQGLSPLKEECLYLGTLRMDNLPKGLAGKVVIRVTLKVDTNGLLKCAVKVNEQVKEVELVNLFGSQETKTLTLTEKRILKWEAFANRLPYESKEEVLSAVEKYSEGKLSLEQISQTIAKYTTKKTEIVRPSVIISDFGEED
jgi:molecular chaperone DnaK